MKFDGFVPIMPASLALVTLSSISAVPVINSVSSLPNPLFARAMFTAFSSRPCEGLRAQSLACRHQAQAMRASTFLSHCAFAIDAGILEACRDAGRDAWTALIAESEVIASIGTREWAKVKT